MKHTKVTKILLMLFAVVLCFGPVGLAGPVGTAFTYQGRLIDANEAADGLYDFQFKLFDDETVGNKLGTDVNVWEVDVIDGYFTVELDFGSAFDGNERWLDIGVRPGDLDDPNAYTSLTPRQKITPAPYAIRALSGGSGGESLWQVNGSDIYYNAGNVGISEANPVAKLVVGQGGDILLKAADEDAGDIIFQTATGTQKGRMWGAPAAGQNKLHLSSADNAADITIDPNGNVGIGTTSPSQKLHVSGSAQFDKSGPELGRLTLNTVARNDPGRYGIVFANNLLAPFLGDDTQDQTFGFLTGWSDTRSYSARLQVYGRATGNWGCYIGMSHDGTDGLINTDVGDIVLSPALNVGIGTTSPAAKLGVNGDISAASSYKIGGDTVLSTAGTSNTLVGVGAGVNNTGSHNTFSGHYAGYSNTTGSLNSSVGSIALLNNTTGANNSAMGYMSLYANTTGSSNSAMGAWTLRSNTTGINNIAIGAAALSYNTTGTFNSALGTGSLYSNTTGSNNTAIGQNAGYSATGSSNVFLGNNAGYNETGSSKLYIANDSADANVLIYGDFSTGRVGISQVNPTEALDVNGTIRLRGIVGGTGTPVALDATGKLWRASSSRRYKTNIEPIDTGLVAVLNLRPVRFEYKKSGQKDIGLIAEEVEKISPDLVIYDGQGRPDAVKYDKIALYLLSVVKDQQKENEDIKARLSAMESQMARLSLQQEGGIK